MVGWAAREQNRGGRGSVMVMAAEGGKAGSCERLDLRFVGSWGLN